jgi:hypothetical protein
MHFTIRDEWTRDLCKLMVKKLLEIGLVYLDSNAMEEAPSCRKMWKSNLGFPH